MLEGNGKTIAWSRAFLIAVAVLLVGCSETTDDIFERAKALQDGGQYQAAVAEYRSILAEEPEHAEARFGVGEASVYLGEYSRGIDSLERAAALGISPERVQPLLAYALLAQREHSRLIDSIDPEAMSSPAARAELHAVRAQAYLRMGERGEARRASEEALALDEGAAPAQVAAGRIAMADGNMQAARQHFDAALAGEERPAAALIGSAQIARGQGRFEDALSLFTEAAETPPTDISASAQEKFLARGQQIELLLSLDRVEEAREPLEIMRRQSDRHPYSNYLAGVVAHMDGDLETAVERLQIAHSSEPDSAQINMLLGTVRSERGQHQQAIRLLRGVVSDNPDQLGARLRLAAAYEAADQQSEAVRVLIEGVQRAGDDPEALARLAEAAGDNIDAVIEAMGTLEGDDDGTRLNLARALVGAGEVDPAMAMLRTMNPDEADTDLVRRQFLAISALRDGDVDEARDLAEELVADYPDRGEAHNLLGGIQLSSENYQEASAAFARARDIDPDNAQFYFNLGLAAASAGDMDGAIQYFEQGLDRSPENVTAILRFAELQRQAGNTDEAIEWAGRATELDSDNAAAWLSLARLQVAFGDAAEALRAANRVVEMAPQNPLSHALQGLARLDTGDSEGAVQSFQTGLEQAPGDPGLRFHLGRAQAAAGQTEAAVRTLEELTDEQTGNVDAIAALARLYVDQGDTERAVERARMLQENEGGLGQGALLEGHAHRAGGDAQAAAVAYGRALEADELEAVSPLLASRTEAGHDEPAQPVEQWLENNAENHSVRFALANWYLERGDYADAARHYEVLKQATDGENPAILNNLAWLYGEIGDDRAEDTARQAHALAPDSPQIQDTLGWILYNAGDAEAALPYLSDAVEGAPDDAEIRYHYGVILAELGETQRAREALERSLEQDDEADWSSDAKQRLDAL